MKKLLLTLLVTGGITSGSFAQSALTSPSPSKPYQGFSIGLDAALPTGVASEVYNFGLGGSIKYDAFMYPGIYFTISGGYEAFFIKDEFKFMGAPSTDGYVPIKGGFKFYLNNGFFIEGQAGVAIYTGEGSFTAFAYSPGIGYTFNGFEVGARYEGWVKDGTMGQAAVRLAFKFK